MIKTIFLKLAFLSLLLCFYFHSSLSLASGFRCWPSVKDTGILVLEKNDIISISIENGMGYKFMPQFEGGSSLYSLDFFKMQGEDLSGLGDRFNFSWKKSNCELNTAQFNVSCSGESSNQVSDIKSYGLSTTEIIEKYSSGKSEKRRFRFSMEKINFYFVTLEFDLNTCEEIKLNSEDTKFKRIK